MAFFRVRWVHTEICVGTNENYWDMHPHDRAFCALACTKSLNCWCKGEHREGGEDQQKRKDEESGGSVTALTVMGVFGGFGVCVCACAYCAKKSQEQEVDEWDISAQNSKRPRKKGFGDSFASSLGFSQMRWSFNQSLRRQSLGQGFRSSKLGSSFTKWMSGKTPAREPAATNDVRQLQSIQLPTVQDLDLDQRSQHQQEYNAQGFASSLTKWMSGYRNPSKKTCSSSCLYQCCNCPGAKHPVACSS